MTPGAARFAARYPVVWHVIEVEGAGPWLSRTGLLPAATLLHLAGEPADGTNRDDFRILGFVAGQVAVLRQQLMAEGALAPTLAGRFAGRPDAWRRHINAHVFFWTEPRRRDAFLRACLRLRARSTAAPGSVPAVVLTYDTADLLGRHQAAAFFTRINSGSTVRGGAWRGGTRPPSPRSGSIAPARLRSWRSVGRCCLPAPPMRTRVGDGVQRQRRASVSWLHSIAPGSPCRRLTIDLMGWDCRT